MAKKTALAIYMDEIAAEVHKYLKTIGYRKFGHTYNRETEPGLIQVINLQAAPYFSSIHGLFTVNLSVYIREVEEVRFESPPPRDRHVKEYDGDFRMRLDELIVRGYDPLQYYDAKSRWWRIGEDTQAIGAEITTLLQRYGQPYLDEYNSRAAILGHWTKIENNSPDLENDWHVFWLHRVAVIILAKQGDLETAKRYMQEEYNILSKHWNPAQKEYARQLAQRLGISLDTQ
ncbi:MAG: DUF4304 domain-containing protein [Chloroflexi bacterium]|nr:DUF4304 domain-containing protein [Chloroflexota bacterium]NOG62218.1 DUF4304 domain-containing protein [Chloroflexota bacterium]